MTNSEALGYFKRDSVRAVLLQIGNGFITWEKLKDFVERKRFIGWFTTFLDEKQLPFKTFEVEHNGMVHFINSDIVIDLIKKAPVNEQIKIRNVIIEIDFYNEDVNKFFEHLATGYIKTNF